MLMPTRSKPFRDPTKATLARRGLIFLLVIAAALVLMQLYRSGALGGPPVVTAEVRNAGGSLMKNSDVKVNGVIVGHVTEIAAGDDGKVDVRLAIDKDKIGAIPANYVAAILPATVFGTSYVDLRKPSGAQASQGSVTHPLSAGDVIEADRSQHTLELQDALDDIDGLVKALDPGKLSEALGAVSTALDGRGETIGEAAVRLDHYLRGLQPEMAVLKGDLAKLSSFLQVVREVAPNLLDATSHALNVLDMVVAHQQQLQALLTSGRHLSDTTRVVLARNTAKLTQFLGQAATIIDALFDNRGQIPAAVHVNTVLHGIAQKAIAKGFLNVDGPLVTGVPGYYGVGDRPSYGGGR